METIKDLKREERTAKNKNQPISNMKCANCNHMIGLNWETGGWIHIKKAVIGYAIVSNKCMIKECLCEEATDE